MKNTEKYLNSSQPTTHNPQQFRKSCSLQPRLRQAQSENPEQDVRSREIEIFFDIGCLLNPDYSNKPAEPIIDGPDPNPYDLCHYL